MRITFNAGSETDGPEEVDAGRLTLLVMADLGTSGGAGTVTLTSAEDFAAELSRAAPALAYEVPNLLDARSERLDVRLVMRALRDFTPAGVCDQIPLLGRARSLVDELRGATTGKQPAETIAGIVARYSDLAGVHEALQLGVDDPAAARPQPANAPAAARPEPANAPLGHEQDDAVDRILGLVALPETQGRASAAVDAVVGHLTRGRSGGTPARSAIDRALARASERLWAQLDLVLHHDQFQRLERIWRGLKFLVDRCDFRTGVQVEVYQATRGELFERLEQALEAADDQAPPHVIVIAGYPFEQPETCAEPIQRLGELAEAVQVPALVAVAPTFFGFEATTDPGKELLPTRLEEPRYTKWNALRRKPCARWLAPVTNPLLLRAPYDPESSRQLPYRETVSRDEDLLFGDPVWAVAARIASGFKSTGWPTLVLGRDGRLESLPLRNAPAPAGRSVQIPLWAFLSEQTVADLARSGFMALACRRNSDAAYLAHAPTLYLAEGERTLRRAETGFLYQLFVARIVREVTRIRERQVGLARDPALGEVLRRQLQALIASTGPGAYVDVETEARVDGSVRVQLDLRAGQFMLGGARVELDFEV